MSIAAPDMVVDQGMQVPIPPPLSMPVPPPIQNVVQMQAVAEPSPALAMAAEVQGNQGVHVQHVQQAATMMMQAVPAYQPGFAPNHTYPVHHVVPGAPPQMDGMEQKGPESGSKRNRSWSEEERNSHKDACTGKRKLTLGEKLDIVRLHESTDPAEKKNQVQLASMYEKSRSAISKILQPDFVNKLKEIAATGVCTGVKRFIQSEHPALEKNIKQWVDGQLANGAIDFSGKRGDGAVSAVCKAAQELAVQAGIENFKASHGWYTRFIRRFGYTEADDNQRRKSEMEGRMQGGIQPMSAMQRVVPAMQVLAQVHFTVKLRVIPRGATEMSGKMMTVRLDVENDVKASRGYDMLLAMIRIQFGEDLGLDPKGAPGDLPGCRISYREVEGGEERLISSAHELTAALDMPRPRAAVHDGILLTVSAI
mmetsp:Transcript_43277/g.102962  ORF Transcript_43277/g.102962 Transcript_43277/m.102962 type:complete len:423 (-) Transcript_43277:14-1282(-)